MANQLILKEFMLHDASVKSIRIKEEKSALEEYLVSVGKLSIGEEHPMRITTLDVGGVTVYSVTVTVGQEDILYCEARM